MPKSASEGTLDASLNHVAARATRLTLCAGAPADAVAASTAPSAGGAMLAGATLTPGLAGAFAVSDGLVSGRRLVVAARTDLTVAEAGTADHVALVDTVAGELLLVTTLTEPEVLSVGGAISTRSFAAEIQPPT